MNGIKRHRLLLAWIVSMTATLGSLFFSEILLFIPCEFCWYQRIFMYPLTILLGIAFFRKDESIRIYVLPLAVIGAGFSVFHYLIQKTDFFSAGCSVFIPCSGTYINWLGFITIPFMAGIAFLLIILLLAFRR